MQDPPQGRQEEGGEWSRLTHHWLLPAGGRAKAKRGYDSTTDLKEVQKPPQRTPQAMGEAKRRRVGVDPLSNCWAPARPTLPRASWKIKPRTPSRLEATPGVKRSRCNARKIRLRAFSTRRGRGAISIRSSVNHDSDRGRLLRNPRKATCPPLKPGQTDAL